MNYCYSDYPSKSPPLPPTYPKESWHSTQSCISFAFTRTRSHHCLVLSFSINFSIVLAVMWKIYCNSLLKLFLCRSGYSTDSQPIHLVSFSPTWNYYVLLVLWPGYHPVTILLIQFLLVSFYVLAEDGCIYVKVCKVPCNLCHSLLVFHIVSNFRN